MCGLRRVHSVCSIAQVELRTLQNNNVCNGNTEYDTLFPPYNYSTLDSATIANQNSLMFEYT